MGWRYSIIVLPQQRCLLFAAWVRIIYIIIISTCISNAVLLLVNKSKDEIATNAQELLDETKYYWLDIRQAKRNES